MPWITLHQTWHIYWQIYPQSISIDPLNTITPNLADLPPSIKQRCLAYCYTKLDRSTGRSTPLQSIEHSCLEYCYTKLGRSTPKSINHRCLEYHYTKLERSTPSQSSIDALNTATPNLADLPQRTSTYERPFPCEGNYLVWCSGIPYISGQLGVGGILLYVKLIWCSCIP